MSTRLRYFMPVVLALSALPAYADMIGVVIAVADGDTLTVQVDQARVKVRLVDIDAPELKQTFGDQARRSLTELCLNKTATLEERGKDRYGRTLARVHCDGVDANAEQVQKGMAWVFVRYAPKDSPLYGLEVAAKLSKQGVWEDDEPVPPWEWRKH